MHKDRSARLVRVQHLLYVSPRGLQPAEIAERCGVSVRTAYRDLRALQETLRLPVWTSPDGRYGLEKGHFLPPLSLTLREATTLFLATRLMSRYADERDASVQTALAKMATILPRPVGAHVEATARAMDDLPPDTHYSQVLDVLAKAWAEQRRVRLDYARPGDQPTRRELEPYFLEPSAAGHSCYVIGRDLSVGDIRTFKIERIREIELLDESFEVPGDFDPLEYLRGSWTIYDEPPIRVRVRFTPAAAPRVREAVWHRSQQQVELPDGSIELAITVNGETEITPWILSWGAEAEVLEPETLRRRCAEIAARQMAHYGAAAPETAGRPVC